MRKGLCPSCRETRKTLFYTVIFSLFPVRGREAFLCGCIRKMKRGEIELPSEKILTEKQALVAALREKLSGSVAGVIVDYKGISVVNDTKLRAELREAGVEYSVIKNTMLRLAVKDTALEGMTEQMTGSSAIAISKEDPTAAAKILNKYAESSKGAFALKAGYMEGKVMDVPSIVAIANLPNREGMLSMLLSALTGNLRGLAVGLKAVADKKAAEEAA